VNELGRPGLAGGLRNGREGLCCRGVEARLSVGAACTAGTESASGRAQQASWAVDHCCTERDTTRLRCALVVDAHNHIWGVHIDALDVELLVVDDLAAADRQRLIALIRSFGGAVGTGMGPSQAHLSCPLKVPVDILRALGLSVKARS
jgi:hypothetical protein